MSQKPNESWIKQSNHEHRPEQKPLLHKNNSNLLYLNAHHFLWWATFRARIDFLLALLSKAVSSWPLFAPWYKTMMATFSSSFLWRSSQWANTQKVCQELDTLQHTWTGLFVLTLYSPAATSAFDFVTNFFPESSPLHLLGKLGLFSK